MLFHEEQATILRHGCHGRDTAGIDPLDVFPVVCRDEAQEPTGT
jgi:hypothetical protein